MKRLLRAFVFALVMLPTVTFAQSVDDAGDVSEVDKDRVGPLRERVRPVSGYMFLKRGRFEFSPSVTRSIKDPFFTKTIVGARLGFFPTEELGLHLKFGYGLAEVSGAAQICTNGENGTVRGCRVPRFNDLDGRAPGQITQLAGAELEYAPIYGKVALVSESFLHFDLHVFGGASLVGYQGPTDSGSQAERTVGGSVGIGSRIFFNKWLTARLDLHDLIYSEKIRPIPATSLRNQLMFELGVSVFLPTSFIPE